MRSGLWAAGLALCAVSPALADDLRDYCPERPGLDTPACIVDKGHVSIETAAIDWTHERDAGSVTDTVLIADTVARLGVTDAIEARIGWTPYGHVRERDRTTGAVSNVSRVGDAYVGVKANLMNPDGQGLSIALLPQATIPVGRRPVGAGDWSAGLLVPITYSLGESIQLEATPEVDAAVDEDGSGRHLAYGSAAGVGLKLSKALTLTIEAEALRDRDPSGHETEAFAAASLGWMAKDDLQLDLFGIAGLNHNSPDVELMAGVSKRF